jgi:two-component system alkaline phosphatase synthesis response regulator PhoP
MAQKVLIVDDDPTFTQTLQYWLERKGFEVDLCTNGGLACDTICENEYAIVFMDYFLPSLKGDEVCQSVRDNKTKAGLPIVMMTAFSDYQKEFFTEKGATDVLFKPFDHDDFMAVVDKYIVV